VNGNDNLNASPVNHPPTTNKQSVGETSPPILVPILIPQILEQPEPKSKFKRIVRKVFKIQHSTKYIPIGTMSVTIGEMKFYAQYNAPMNKMNFSGPIYIGKVINQEIHKETIINQQHNENNTDVNNSSDNEDVVEDADYEEVNTEPPQLIVSNAPNEVKRDFAQSPLMPYIAQKETAQILLTWLHNLMDSQEYPKPKLEPLRAAYEAGCFTQRIPLVVYEREFGHITTSCYYTWMKGPLKYDTLEIDALIAQIPIKLT